MNPRRMDRLSACVVNMGCHKNQVDAEVIIGLLDDAGYTVVADPSISDIIIINTCGFIAAARQESAEMLAEMARYRRDGVLKRLVVAGCMADRDRRWLLDNAPAPDLFVSSYDLDRIPEYLAAPDGSPPPMSPEAFVWPQSTRWVSTPRSFGFIKIADGCNNRCTYCRIPHLRGGFRSKNRDDIIAEAEELIETGRRELVLLSQDTTAYGSDRSGNGDFTELVDTLSGLDGLKWLRLMYLYPSRISPRLLDLMNERETICRYLDIPLQHVNSEVLTKMNRRLPGFAGGNSMPADRFIGEIRRRVPGITIRTTLMTGFPGESHAAFGEMAAFVEAGHVDHLGVFAWSP
ncbi:MAG TPA: MiaB/RimO family radical SAM methylthiotransferase, partial [bacterium]|nr:MiaB/RimO family radical SAM methylthiotransferase [bacterium]